MADMEKTIADIEVIKHDRTFAGVFQSITKVTVHGVWCHREAMEVFKRKDGTWGMEWYHKSFRDVFATMEEAIEAAIPHVLDNANRVRGF